MTRRRWIADETSGNTAALTGEHAAHLVRVLRAQVGQEFELSTGDSIRVGRITAIRDSRVEFELGQIIPVREVLDLTLLLAIFKFDRMEWAIEKCTELGVSKIIPMVANLSDRHLAAAAVKRVERWRRIAREAAEQSRRANAPEISLPVSLREGIDQKAENRILLSEIERDKFLKQVLEQRSRGSLLLAVGPEGGWTAEENGAFLRAGWTSASVGRTILRAETAAIAAVAVAVSAGQ
ncbi:MAG TPA: RsmE family RNA methyltransferase [Terriglobales bacterium]|nr:RsmE family RNA methyltransferase [Terriglobales bacterium]